MSTPFPLNTALDRALGRQTITTGMPVRSNPVTLAMRVIPNAAANVLTRATVSSGGTLRRVSGQYVTPTSLFREFVLRSSSKRILSQRRSIVIHFSPGIFEDSWAAIGLLRRSAPRNDGSVRQFPVGNDGAPPSNLVLRMRRSNAANSVRAPPIAIGRPARSTAKVINSTIAAEYARSGLRPQMQPPRRPMARVASPIGRSSEIGARTLRQLAEPREQGARPAPPGLAPSRDASMRGETACQQIEVMLW